MSKSFLLRSFIAAAIAVTIAASVNAQNRIRLPSQVQLQPVPPPPTGGMAPMSGPQPQVYTPPGVSLGTQIQPFDPYSVTVPPPAQTIAPPTGLVQPPGIPPAPGYPAGSVVAPPTLPPNALPPAGSLPPTLPPGSPVPQASSVPPPPLGVTQTPGLTPLYPNGWAAVPVIGRAERLIQDTGFIYTWLAGGSGSTDLGINEVELFTSMVFKNFANSAYGLRLTPGFIFDFLDGPSEAGKISLPSKVYSAYLDALWLPQLTPQFSGDLNLRVGVYSDFDHVTSQSVRITGRGLGVLQITPNAAFKLGIEYLDRNDIKLLPAGGVLWTPNPHTRFDIYFPEPKLAQYWTTIGNTEVWWYIGAEYGGGAWTMSRETAPFVGERFDINDIRVFIGCEWDQLQRTNGLFEIGWVTARQIYVPDRPSENVDPGDTIMLRAGLSF
ncbi:MAG: hypothetical protein AAGF97_01760 [Planctomycetota bacterium]